MKIIQEIKDLFAENTGNYEPTWQEIKAIDSGLENLLGASADEPMFIVHAHDKESAEVVELWARLNEMNGGDHADTVSARQFANKMRAWQPGVGV